MRRWTFSILIILFIISVTSCKKEIEFTSVQQQVYNSYQMGDSLVFERNETDTITFIVDDMTLKFEKDRSWGSNSYYEIGRIDLTSNDRIDVGHIIISGICCYDDIKYTFSDISATGFERINDLIVNDFKYQDVYIATSNSDTVWFTPIHKIIKMSSKQGDIYERIM